MEKQYDVIGVENLIMDLALRIDVLPETDGIVSLKDFLWQSGGNASSAIAALSRLGAKCAMVGQIGNDEFGRFCLNDMKYHGVDVSHVYEREGMTALCVCLAEEATQGRSFLGRKGDNPPMSPQEVDEAFIASAKYIHISAAETSAKELAIQYARKNGVTVSFDAGGYSERAAALIDVTDILIMSHQFYRGLFGEDENYIANCRSLLKRGTKIVVATLGAAGCVGTDGTEDFTLPPFSGYPIVDTTGAGDVFHGGFLFAHNQGRSLKECARFASAVSYINCTSLGGRVGIPDLEMVETFLATGVIESEKLEPRKAHYRNIMRFI